MKTAEASSALTECTATRYSVPPPEPRPGRVPGHVPVAEPFDLRRVQQRSRGTPVCQQRRPVGLRRHGDRNLFALRSTDPGVPLDHPDPVAPDSDRYLQAMLGRCDRRTRKPKRRPGRGRRGTPPKTSNPLLAQPLSKTISIFAATPVPAAAVAGRRASKEHYNAATDRL